jgi:hypothetical protein
MLRIFAGFADDDLDDLAVLSEVVVAAQCVEQAVLADSGRKTGHIDKVFLDDSQAGEVLATERVGFRLLCLLLPYLRVLLGLLRDLLLVLGHPVQRQRCSRREGAGDPLFRRNGLPFYGGVVIRAATGRTQAVHGRLDVVVAELAYLAGGQYAGSRRRAQELACSVPGSRRDTAGSSCRTGRTPRHIADSTPLPRRRRTGPAVATWWSVRCGVCSNVSVALEGVRRTGE